MSQDIQTLLRQAADEIASEGHNAWGNLMTWAADHIEALERQLAEAEKSASLYEHIRTLNPRQFAELWQRHLASETPFDELVAVSRYASKHWQLLEDDASREIVEVKE